MMIDQSLRKSSQFEFHRNFDRLLIEEWLRKKLI
jgi:hypothetical protein